MQHYKNIAAFTKEFEVASKEGLRGADSCYDKLLEHIFNQGLLWPRYHVSEYSSSFVLTIGTTYNGDETESFQIMPEPLAHEPQLVITTPSTDTLVQCWPKSLTSTRYRCTWVVTTFSDLNKASKAWIKYRARMLELKAAEIRRLEVLNDNELEIFKQYM